jgi:predicted metal-dependent peptidase
MFSKEMLEKLDRIKLKLLLGKKLNFISSLLATLSIGDMKDSPIWKYVEEGSYGCPTACTDGTEILIYEDWFMSLDDDIKEAILLHEVMHIAKLHPLRGKNLENRDIANIAFDIIVNRDVIKMGYSENKLRNDGSIIEPKYWDLSEEEIYNILYKKLKDKAPNAALEGKVGNSNQPMSDLKQDVIPCDGEDTKKEREILSKVSQALDLAKSRGWETPEGLESIIDNLLHPKLKWNVILRRYLNELTPSGIRTWSRPNRRYPDVYRPSKDKDYGHIRNIEVYVDTSGSVSDDELQEYLTEINYMHELMKPDVLTIYDFDTRIRQKHEFYKYDKITSLAFQGRGGTDYVPVMSQIEKNRPQFAVIFTDLCCDIPQPPKSRTNIIWVRTGNYEGAKKPSYGKVFNYDKE